MHEGALIAKPAWAWQLRASDTAKESPLSFPLPPTKENNKDPTTLQREGELYIPDTEDQRSTWHFTEIKKPVL